MPQLVGAAVMLAATGSYAACPRHTAPGVFNNPKQPWGKTDTGAIVDGFIELQRPKPKTPGELYKVMHGVDLSRFNTVEHREILNCGGAFAFVQLDEAFEGHVAKLKHHGVRHIPYAIFLIAKQYRSPSVYSPARMTPPEIERMMKVFDKIGSDAGDRFVKRVSNLGADGLPVTNLAGLNDRIVGLDVEEKLIGEENSTREQRQFYGRFYARATCAWIRTVRKTHPQLVVFLYTTPSVYGDYLRFAYEDENKCLQELPIWIARTTPDAGDVIRPSRTSADQFAQRMCLNSGNRCTVHQYTHRATFAARGSTIRNVPPHIDLDRLFMIKKIQTGVGFRYVRADDGK